MTVKFGEYVIETVVPGLGISGGHTYHSDKDRVRHVFGDQPETAAPGSIRLYQLLHISLECH